MTLSTRLNMHQYVPDPGNLLPNFVFHLVGDFMRLLDGHLRVHLDMHVCVELISHLTHQTFLDTINPFDGFGNMPNAISEFPAGYAVHQFIQGGPEQPPAVPGDNPGRDNRGDIVSRFITFSPDQRHADANACCERRYRVSAMMPCVGLHGRTFHRDRLPQYEPKERFLDQYDSHQYYQRKGRWRYMRIGYFMKRLNDDPSGGHQQHCRDRCRGDWFRFAVTVRMILVGRFCRHHDATPDNYRTEDVG